VVGAFASLALLCFLTFDVLDLDGSNLARGTQGDAFTLEAVGADLERMLTLIPHSPLPADGPRTAVVSVVRPARYLSHASPVFFRLQLRFGTALPRARTEHTHVRTASSGAAEPA
jgi:hypothetical protein